MVAVAAVVLGALALTDCVDRRRVLIVGAVAVSIAALVQLPGTRTSRRNTESGLQSSAARDVHPRAKARLVLRRRRTPRRPHAALVGKVRRSLRGVAVRRDLGRLLRHLGVGPGRGGSYGRDRLDPLAPERSRGSCRRGLRLPDSSHYSVLGHRTPTRGCRPSRCCAAAGRGGGLDSLYLAVAYPSPDGDTVRAPIRSQPYRRSLSASASRSTHSPATALSA